MTDKSKSILSQAGVDLISAKERMMGNEKLLLRLLFKVDTEKNYAELADAFGAKDAERAVELAHAMKGLFGGLSVIPLYELFTRQTALLRAGDFSAAEALLPAAKAHMDALRQAVSQLRLEEENS